MSRWNRAWSSSSSGEYRTRPSRVSNEVADVFVFGLNDEVVHTGYFRMSHYILVIGSVPRTSPG